MSESDKVRFAFGQNWSEYAVHVMNEASLEESRQGLETLLAGESLASKRFLDIGSGSGLHTVAAVQMGATDVEAFDIDENSVAVTQQTVTRFVPQPQQASVNVRQASILNESDLASTAPADVVYSWGVLHHTGAMWQAIETAASLVTDDGLFIIAIYNRHVTSPAWHIIKRIYNISPQFIKRLMYYVFYAVIFLAKFAVTGRNPLNKERGMEFSVDVVDWIGGYPYEYASIEEITGFVEKLGFETIQTIPAEVGTGCNEFTFRRKSQHTE